jgi:hypothetical protein
MNRRRRRFLVCMTVALTACAPQGPHEVAPALSPTIEPVSPATIPTTAPTPTTGSTVAPASQDAFQAPQLPGEAGRRPVRVGLYGDSLAWEAEPSFVAEARQRGWTTTGGTLGGTAPCDWQPAIGGSLDVVVLVFSGNNLTPCAAGVGGRELADAYASTFRSIREALPDDTLLVLVGTPPVRAESTDVATAGTRVSVINMQMALSNELPNTEYVDAGAAVAGPGRRYVDRLPCLPGEPCEPDGTVAVRSPDGVHFCPAGAPAVDGVTVRCNVDSPGAGRFATAIVDGVAAVPSLLGR